MKTIAEIRDFANKNPGAWVATAIVTDRHIEELPSLAVDAQGRLLACER